MADADVVATGAAVLVVAVRAIVPGRLGVRRISVLHEVDNVLHDLEGSRQHDECHDESDRKEKGAHASPGYPGELPEASDSRATSGTAARHS